MPLSGRYDALVIGAGLNGLAAALVLARAGLSVLVIEGRETIGGGCRSAELTLPRFIHDICATIFSLGVSSPFFSALPLAEHGLEMIYPPAACAHPLDDGTAVIVEHNAANPLAGVDETAATLGPDAAAYRGLIGPVVGHWPALTQDLLGPLPLPPQHLLPFFQFSLRAISPAFHLAKALFRGERARAVFAGMAAHSLLPLEKPLTSAFGVVLSAGAHAVGWPLAKGGSQNFVNALASLLCSYGGEVITGWKVASLDELPPHRIALFDVTPRALLGIAGRRFPASYQRTLQRFRYGPGVFKIDWALSGPIPWRAEEVARCAVAHLGGSPEEIAASERAAWRGEHTERPFVLLAQPTLFDPTRAPAGKHTAWAYCHVPHGSTVDMTAAIEAQVERFAPGFRDLILARHTFNAQQMEAYNPNYIGGDINGGAQDVVQHFARPVLLRPYATPAKGIYLCSSSTPPGGGVHGMCGYHAARLALQDLGVASKPYNSLRQR
ncbi:MAG: NAD(P)/FAD-dependent oxidoreductase [Anaerolineales bacterium]|nr:NAD(P)/FAD-dependent oxidoreductase [Anaerolineales bacterium]